MLGRLVFIRPLVRRESLGRKYEQSGKEEYVGALDKQVKGVKCLIESLNGDAKA